MKTLRFLLAFIACAAGLHGAGTPTFDTVNGVAIAGGANTITLGKGTTTITLNTTGTIGSAAFTAASAYAPAAGSTSILTLGTIGTGTWQGSIIAPAYLGTGSSITGKYLRGDGTWQAVDGSGAALTSLNADNISTGTLAAARMPGAGVHTGDATGTFPAITLNAAQTGITSVGTLTGGATGAGFTVALSTSTITGTLADARLSANVPLLNAANTFTAANIFSANPLTLSGNQSRAAWTTTGTGLVQAAASYTDTSSSGTVAAMGVNVLNAPTFIASSATTYSDTWQTRLNGPPVASTNVTQTRPHTLIINDSTTGYRTLTGGAFLVTNAVGTAANAVAIGAGNITISGELAIVSGTTLETQYGNGIIWRKSGSDLNINPGNGAFLNVSSSASSTFIAFRVAAGTDAAFGYITASAVSGTACALAATGSGSNIDINLTPKGTGVTNLNGTGAAVAGTLAVTGATTLSAALITTPEAIAPALDAGITVSVATVATSFALNGVNALTLANGTNGQIKTIVCTAVTAAGTATLTPTTCSGFTTVAFTAAGQTLTLQYFTTGGWVILSVRGATPA